MTPQALPDPRTAPLLGTFFTASTVAPVLSTKTTLRVCRFSKPVGSADKDQEQYKVSRALLAKCAYCMRFCARAKPHSCRVFRLVSLF